MDRVVVVHLHEREMQVPIGLSFVGDGRQHLCHRMVDAFGSTVGLRVVRTSEYPMRTQQSTNRGRKFARKMRTVVGQQFPRDTPMWYVLVHEDVGSALRGIVEGFGVTPVVGPLSSSASDDFAS